MDIVPKETVEMYVTRQSGQLWGDEQLSRSIRLSGSIAADLEKQTTGVDGTPDEWGDDEKWNDAIDGAREKADLAAGKGTLTVKQIDGRGYSIASGAMDRRSRVSTSRPLRPLTAANQYG